jgi:tryptophanyl-tRNA synthetase
MGNYLGMYVVLFVIPHQNQRIYYIGAIRQWVTNQDQYENFFCVVDLHAITAPHDPKKLKEDTLSAAAMYLACGIDPSRSTVFVQSHVRAHTELAWLLNCITPLNWLERMIQFKEKSVKQGGNVGVGLFDYPGTHTCSSIIL